MNLNFRGIGVSLALLGCVAAPAHAETIAQRLFNAGDGNFSVSGDFTAGDPEFVPTGGNPGGYIQTTDRVTGATIFFLAPVAFEGDISAAYDGTLQFDILSTGVDNPFSDSDVILRSGGLSLHLDLPDPLHDFWTHYNVLLVEGAWHVGSLGGAVATQAQFQSVLSNVTSLEIRGEYQTGADVTGLDNVILSSIPVPAPLALVGIGLVAMGLARRRRTA